MIAKSAAPFHTSPGSFRDPSGFVFTRHGKIFRQISPCYRAHYEKLIGSGLYAELAERNLLIDHEEASLDTAADPSSAWKVIRPRPLPFVSYPYEWSFAQLRDAALLTLEIERLAFERGMTLKDASAYNVTFLRGAPIFFDTLSFEACDDGVPWKAYRQFCQHFLAPLALMAFRDRRLGLLLRNHIDGVPLDMAAKLLPARAWLRFPLLLHIRLHAASQKKYANRPAKPGDGVRVSRNARLGLLDSLTSAVEALKASRGGEGWKDYYEGTNYNDAAFASKRQIVGEFLDEFRPETVWDLGSNTGVFSRLAASKGAEVIAVDFDQEAVEAGYQFCREQGVTAIHSIWLDLTNPSPGVGWASEERSALAERGPADTILALALVHHLAIGNNTPLPKVAEWLASLCKTLIIEFVPKGDSQVERLLASREDVFDGYTREGFEKAFEVFFEVVHRREVSDSRRTLYAMRGRRNP